jgi:diphthamide biosynthesis methyltransferase
MPAAHVRGRCSQRTDEEEDDAMHATEIQEYARQLLEAHGDKAIAEAAQKAVAFEKSGDKERAQTWRRVEAALLLMHGPRQS